MSASPNRHRADWATIRRQLQRIHLGAFAGPAATSRQRSELTNPARDLFNQFGTRVPAS